MVETLLRHRRIALRFLSIYIFAGLLMMSAIAGGLLTGKFSDLDLVFIVVGAVVGTLGSLLFVVAVFWAREIEKTLKARGSAVLPFGSVDRLIGWAARRALFWAIAVFVTVYLCYR